jgi:hypothetical protein
MSASIGIKNFITVCPEHVAHLRKGIEEFRALLESWYKRSNA